jgi:hypothetical protein
VHPEKPILLRSVWATHLSFAQASQQERQMVPPNAAEVPGSSWNLTKLRNALHTLVPQELSKSHGLATPPFPRQFVNVRVKHIEYLQRVLRLPESDKFTLWARVYFELNAAFKDRSPQARDLTRYLGETVSSESLPVAFLLVGYVFLERDRKERGLKEDKARDARGMAKKLSDRVDDLLALLAEIEDKVWLPEIYEKIQPCGLEESLRAVQSRMGSVDINALQDSMHSVFYGDLPTRTRDSTVQEKRALVAMQQLLIQSDLSERGSATTIVEMFHVIGVAIAKSKKGRTGENETMRINLRTWGKDLTIKGEGM